MIQSLSDVLLLVGIVSLGVVSFLLAILLYNLIFVVMDARQITRRVRNLTEEIEEMLLKPMGLVAQVVDWVQDAIFGGSVFPSWKTKKGDHKKKKKHIKGGFEHTAV